MIKIYKKLTEEQIRRNVIFSSCLSTERTEKQKDNIHEVFKTEDKNQLKDNYETIERLLNDKFFNSSHWRFNIIRR